MSEKKIRHWTLQEIQALPMKVGYSMDRTFEKKEIKWVAIRKDSSDLMGDFLVRLFKKVNDHFEEVDVKKEAQRMAKQLAKSVKATTLIREVLIELKAEKFCDLIERLGKTPQVTMGIRKGSCVFIYIAGKQGPKQMVQITR